MGAHPHGTAGQCCRGGRCRVQEEQQKIGGEAHQDQGLVARPYQDCRPHRARLQGRGRVHGEPQEQVEQGPCLPRLRAFLQPHLEEHHRQSHQGFQAAVAQNEKDLKACQCTSKFDALKKAVSDQQTKAEIQRVARDDAISDLTKKAAENEQIENEIQPSTAQIATDQENFKNTLDKDRELIQTRKQMTEEADKSSKRMLEEIKKKPEIEIDMTDNEAKLAALLGR